MDRNRGSIVLPPSSVDRAFFVSRNCCRSCRSKSSAHLRFFLSTSGSNALSSSLRRDQSDCQELTLQGVELQIVALCCSHQPCHHFASEWPPPSISSSSREGLAVSASQPAAAHLHFSVLGLLEFLGRVDILWHNPQGNSSVIL